MGKKGSGGKKEARNTARGSSWSFWIWIAGVVVIVAWYSLRRDGLATQKTKSPGTDSIPDDDEDDMDERLDVVREALFGDTQSLLGAAKDGANSAKASKQGTGFASAEYWDKMYTKTRREHHDWYGTWNGKSTIRIKPYVLPELPAQVQSVLNIGCGNSIFAEELASDGYKDIVSIDISQAVIDRMLQKFAGREGLSFFQMDATQMTFKEASFDVVFDKGTLDAMYAGAAELVAKTVQEVFRVLKPGGLFVSLTFGAPTSRKDLNRTSADRDAPPGWERFKMLTLDEIAGTKGQMFYVYLMSKPA